MNRQPFPADHRSEYTPDDIVDAINDSFVLEVLESLSCSQSIRQNHDHKGMKTIEQHLKLKPQRRFPKKSLLNQ